MWCLCDWGVLCQCYWGMLILIIYCLLCGDVLVLEQDLLVVLLEDFVLDGMGNLFVKFEVFLNCMCLICGVVVKCEIDMMDIFVDLLWYFLCYMVLDVEIMVDVCIDYWMLMD